MDIPTCNFLDCPLASIHPNRDNGRLKFKDNQFSFLQKVIPVVQSESKNWRFHRKNNCSLPASFHSIDFSLCVAKPYSIRGPDLVVMPPWFTRLICIFRSVCSLAALDTFVMSMFSFFETTYFFLPFCPFSMLLSVFFQCRMYMTNA